MSEKQKLCACCNKREANKTNTHYLTDAVIRSALNQEGLDGNKNRARGHYWDLSGIPQYKYQQSTSPDKIEKVLGGSPTEQKNQEMMNNIDFSVDYIFCDICEDKFTEIENKFTPILQRFRSGEFKDKTEFEFTNEEDIKNIKIFFLMQFWRTAVCASDFQISGYLKGQILHQILSPDMKKLNKLSLSITYLTTEGEQAEYTSNNVGYIENQYNPYVIKMNDFFIQLYEPGSTFPFDILYEVNQKNNYMNFIHHSISPLKINIKSNAERKVINENIHKEKAKQILEIYKREFINFWIRSCGSVPSPKTIMEFINFVVSDGVINGIGEFNNKMNIFLINRCRK